VIRDADKIKAAWRKTDEVWWPGGGPMEHGMIYSDPYKGGKGNKKKGGETSGLARFVREAQRGLNSVLPNIIRRGVVFV
jgi:hypothetical protein